MNKDAKQQLSLLKDVFNKIIKSHDQKRTFPYNGLFDNDLCNLYYKWRPYDNTFVIGSVALDKSIQKQGVFTEFLNYVIQVGGATFSQVEVEMCHTPHLSARLKRDGWEGVVYDEFTSTMPMSWKMKTLHN